MAASRRETPMDIEEERALVADLLMGDRAAVRRLMEHLGPVVARAVAVAPAHLRDDLAGEVWLHLVKDNFLVIQRWAGQGPLGGFVRRTARNRALDLLRARGIETLPMDEEAHARPFTGPPAEEIVIAQRLVACIRECLERLGQAQRDVLRLRHDEDLQPHEIGDRLGTNPNAVRQLLWRAHQNVRRLILLHCRDHLPSDLAERLGTI